MLPSLCAPQPGREDLESSFGEQVQPIPPPTPPSRLSGQLEGPESALFYGLIKTLKASLQCPPTTTPTVSLYSLPHTYRISHARIEICQQLSVPCWFLVPVLSAHHLIPVLIFFSSNLYPLKPINLLCLHLLWNCCGFKLNKSSRSNLPLVDDGCRPWWGGASEALIKTHSLLCFLQTQTCVSDTCPLEFESLPCAATPLFVTLHERKTDNYSLCLWVLP